MSTIRKMQILIALKFKQFKIQNFIAENSFGLQHGHTKKARQMDRQDTERYRQTDKQTDIPNFKSGNLLIISDLKLLSQILQNQLKCTWQG